MRKILYLLAVACVSIATLSSCTSAAPDADEEGVLVMKPWFFGHGGVDPEPVRTGQTWCAFSTDVVYVKMTPIAYDEHIEDAYSDDNTQLDFFNTNCITSTNWKVSGSITELWCRLV